MDLLLMYNLQILPQYNYQNFLTTPVTTDQAS
jgi:hypothetical protein